jgi:L-asparagine transporter-like permease
MHGPEHWFGLIRVWVIIGLFVYGIWTLLDGIRIRAIGLAQWITNSR